MASAALIGSVISTGGLTALVARIVRSNKNTHIDNATSTTERGNENGNNERSNDTPDYDGR